MITSRNAELALEHEQLVAVTVRGGDEDVVEEVWGEAGHREAKFAIPLDTRNSRKWAVPAAVVTSEVLVVGHGALEVALEVHVVQVDVWHVPHAADVEFLKLVGLDGVRRSVGVVIEHDEVLLAADLSDDHVSRSFAAVRLLLEHLEVVVLVLFLGAAIVMAHPRFAKLTALGVELALHLASSIHA